MKYVQSSAVKYGHGAVWMLALLLAYGCGEDNSDPVDPDDSGNPNVTVQPNQTLGTWPHPFDVYAVKDAEKVIVFLHGGGGTKEYSAYQLGLKRTPDGSDYAIADADILVDNKTIVVFPQGQTIPAAPNVPTWNNYVMTSGEDDVQFIRDLIGYITAEYNVSTTCVVGHSNGGMMVNRLWCEAPELFTYFVAISGPPSVRFLDAQTPCTPSLVRRILCIVGSEDGVLQNTDWEAQTWTINPALTQTPAFVDPVLIGDRYFFPSRVTLRCGETVLPGDADAITNGNLTTWSFCGGATEMIRIETATHTMESLQGASGLNLLALAIDFMQ